MNGRVMGKAAAGALLIAIGMALMLGAQRDVQRMHEVTPEQTADEVATASAEMAHQDDE